jgi:hypothetical protein
MRTKGETMSEQTEPVQVTQVDRDAAQKLFDLVATTPFGPDSDERFKEAVREHFAAHRIAAQPQASPVAPAPRLELGEKWLLEWKRLDAESYDGTGSCVDEWKAGYARALNDCAIELRDSSALAPVATALCTYGHPESAHRSFPNGDQCSQCACSDLSLAPVATGETAQRELPDRWFTQFELDWHEKWCEQTKGTKPLHYDAKVAFLRALFQAGFDVAQPAGTPEYTQAQMDEARTEAHAAGYRQAKAAGTPDKGEGELPSRESLMALVSDCIERGIGEHDMLRCKICYAEGHNEVFGHPYGIKHIAGCSLEPFLRAAAALTQQQPSGQKS